MRSLIPDARGGFYRGAKSEQGGVARFPAGRPQLLQRLVVVDHVRQDAVDDVGEDDDGFGHPRPRQLQFVVELLQPSVDVLK